MLTLAFRELPNSNGVNNPYLPVVKYTQETKLSQLLTLKHELKITYHHS